jgi:hypothetical protein
MTFFGTMTGSLILDGTVLQLAGRMRAGAFETDGLELIWADPTPAGSPPDFLTTWIVDPDGTASSSCSGTAA